MIGGVAACVNISSAPECACTSTASMCDHYDSDLVLFCDGDGSPTFVYNCSTDVPDQICVNGACDYASEVDFCYEANDGKLVPITPACTSYTLCVSDGTTAFPPLECEAGKYFDFETQNCESLPPNPCVKCEGSCPDPLDCSSFHACCGSVSGNKNQCTDPLMPYYNPYTKVCENNDTVCALLTHCDFNEIIGH